MFYYRCRCGYTYQWKDVDEKTHSRYMDCDIWRCPSCKGQQDSRDIDGGPFHTFSVQRLTESQILEERRGIYELAMCGFSANEIGRHRRLGTIRYLVEELR